MKFHLPFSHRMCLITNVGLIYEFIETMENSSMSSWRLRSGVLQIRCGSGMIETRNLNNFIARSLCIRDQNLTITVASDTRARRWTISINSADYKLTCDFRISWAINDFEYFRGWDHIVQIGRWDVANYCHNSSVDAIRKGKDHVYRKWKYRVLKST